MKTTKISVIVTITVLAILIIGSILYYGMSKSSVTAPSTAYSTPTTSAISGVSTSDMTGLKSYQNSQFGISLKYPADWSQTFSSSANSSNSAMVLNKNGYKLTIEMCSIKDCATAVADQQVDPNDRLLPSVRVPLNVGGFKAWRTVEPLPNGEDDPTLFFDFTFLRKATPSSNNPAFNNTSKFTPVSNWINDNGMVYTINYQLPSTATASNYDHSIISQMDDAVQSIVFGR